MSQSTESQDDGFSYAGTPPPNAATETVHITMPPAPPQDHTGVEVVDLQEMQQHASPPAKPLQSVGNTPPVPLPSHRRSLRRQTSASFHRLTRQASPNTSSTPLPSPAPSPAKGKKHTLPRNQPSPPTPTPLPAPDSPTDNSAVASAVRQGGLESTLASALLADNNAKKGIPALKQDIRAIAAHFDRTERAAEAYRKNTDTSLNRLTCLVESVLDRLDRSSSTTDGPLRDLQDRVERLDQREESNDSYRGAQLDEVKDLITETFDEGRETRSTVDSLQRKVFALEAEVATLQNTQRAIEPPQAPDAAGSAPSPQAGGAPLASPPMPIRPGPSAPAAPLTMPPPEAQPLPAPSPALQPSPTTLSAPTPALPTPAQQQVPPVPAPVPPALPSPYPVPPVPAPAAPAQLSDYWGPTYQETPPRDRRRARSRSRSESRSPSPRRHSSRAHSNRHDSRPRKRGRGHPSDAPRIPNPPTPVAIHVPAPTASSTIRFGAALWSSDAATLRTEVWTCTHVAWEHLPGVFARLTHIMRDPADSRYVLFQLPSPTLAQSFVEAWMTNKYRAGAYSKLQAHIA
ncbi:hypothetical protein C8Q77DRAFT_1162098 [Trametes polyzona]|nr:hypothetical protein C8Q77DRAFT_1162098 [Trametes polyzona]